MLETSVDLKIGQDQGMEHCRNKYNGYMAVINSKEEAVFLTSFLSGLTQSLTAPYAELAGFVGADWPDFTRYLEYQDGSFMTDGTYNDKSGFLFKSLYGAGEPRTCFQLGLNGNIEGCGGSGAVLCEITLDKDTHVCLNNDFLSTVTLNSSTELTVSTNTISSPLCIEYCRGSAQQHKYVLIDEDKCTCATDITFDIERNPANLADSPKWLSNKCSWSSTKTMIGNTANKVAALYNIEYSRQSETAKHASSTCRVFEHEMFYTSYGFQVLHLLSSFNASNLSHFENESTFRKSTTF